MSNELIDILVIVPLEEELVALLEIFPAKENLSTETSFRYLVDIESRNLRILIVQQEGMGRSFASKAVKDILNKYNVGLIVCIGIAGSLTADLNLTDVCYSEEIVDVTDNAKVEDVLHGMDITFSPKHYSTPAEFTAALNFSRLFPELRGAYNEWQADCEALAHSILPEQVIERDGTSRKLVAPRSKNGIIACGLVTKSMKYNERILAIGRKILAIETESGGIFGEGAQAQVPCLTIRGISDHADSNKGRLEEVTGAKVRRIAALNAATFFRLQLKNPHFLAALTRTCVERQLHQLQPSVGDPIPKTDITHLLGEIDSTIDSRLRELSPEYRLQSKGYRLPTPRVRKTQYTSGIGQHFKAEPVEVRDALESDSIILLSLSRTYPDYSLPWVVAANLIKAEVGNKQAIPVVINGDRIRPPKDGLKAASEYPFDAINGVDGLQIIFIINEIPLGSPTKMRTLEAEIRNYPGAKFVIITKNEVNIVAESDFSDSTGASLYNLASISFFEIAHFIQKNFEITAAEAEVIALRLRDTFNHFDLSAHPTYFAGISKEALTSLLQANRRAELIQLAVDGFLTFVVAGDKSRVTLSRTTRSRFLRALASEINIEKRRFDEADLIAYVRSFATKNDFEIDPISFVASFIDSGILHFAEDCVSFSLSFVESYLLADELSKDPIKAQAFFSLDNNEFDIETFDLYAELGASTQIVDHVIDSIDRSIRLFALKAEEMHVLLQDLRPKMLKSLTRLNSLDKSLRRMTEDVKHGKGNIEKKQRILDIIDHVREEAADKSGFGREEGSSGDVQFDSNVEFAMKSWAVGTTLLGAGAEDLDGDTKQRLASKIVQLGSVIIHHWTSANVSVDFDQIKKDLLSDESLSELSRDTSTEAAEIKIKIDGVIDLLQFAFFAEPTRRVMGHLCKSARQRVLAASVERANPEGVVDKLIHGIWLSDIDSHRGEKNLLSVVKELPPIPFTRLILGAHLINSVFWDHARKDDRLKLLDIAAEVIKPLTRLDKGRLTRLLESE